MQIESYEINIYIGCGVLFFFFLLKTIIFIIFSIQKKIRKAIMSII